MKFISKIVLLVLIVYTPNAIADDHDNKHITFINQTNKQLTFNVDVTGFDRHKTLSKHSANYESFVMTPGSCGDNNYEIIITLNDKNGKQVARTHRRCGEDLYIWHQDGEYKTNDEPHIKAGIDGCDKDENKPVILFAHGFNATPGAFNKYARHAKDEKGWRVFRTSVSEDGSIAKRAHMLAKYITKAADQCNIGDRQLRIVAHSMGGLDIRYIVSNPEEKEIMREAAKKIERIYTIATPHQGVSLGGLPIHTSDAANDLGITQMKNFNKKNPYKKFKVDDKQVPLLAMRFHCKEKEKKKDSDGTVKIFSQIYPDAPYSKNIYTARHGTNVCKTYKGVSAELSRIKILDFILNDNVEGGKDIEWRE